MGLESLQIRNWGRRSPITQPNTACGGRGRHLMGVAVILASAVASLGFELSVGVSFAKRIHRRGATVSPMLQSELAVGTSNHGD